MAALHDLQSAVNKVAEQVAASGIPTPPHGDGRGTKRIRDVIWGFHKVGPAELKLIDSPFFQRLRHIYQTALSFQTYPCSVHSRFEHSLGVYTVAQRLLEAIGDNNPNFPIDKTHAFEVTSAALLHDIGHGPFSHSSEDVYRRDPIFKSIQKENPFLFATASPSEILAWCILHSNPFQDLWEEANELQGMGGDIDHVAAMIMGADSKLPEVMRPLGHIVNGPFDADKLDYMSRDGYYTGLTIRLDVQRLLDSIVIAELTGPSGDKGLELAVVSSSAPVLEQIIFAKTQLYSQLYHQHKVRASANLVSRLIEACLDQDFNGFSLRNPATYLMLDEYDMLQLGHQNEVAKHLSRRIRVRSLPRRALVLNYPSIDGDYKSPNHERWYVLEKALRGSREATRKAETEIADLAQIPPDLVMLDLPSELKFENSNALIQLAGDKYMPLSEFFPAENWQTAYNTYRKITYIFADNGHEQSVGEATSKWLSKQGVVVNSNAFQLAKNVPAP